MRKRITIDPESKKVSENNFNAECSDNETPRKGWAAQFEMNEPEGFNEEVMHFPNKFDESEWTW